MSKILLVDDDGLLRKLFGKRLTHVGYDVFFAEDGLIGLEMAETVQPDVILLDFQMPKLTGDQVLAELRQSEWGNGIPVIMMSAVTSLEELCDVSQADHVMYKPITNRELLNAIQQFLPENTRN